jgi:hypothetical protein
VETPYTPDAWADETIGGRRIFNAGFRMLGDELADWQLLKAVPMETASRTGEFAYMWQRPHGAGPELLRVQTAELPDWRLAQRRLLEELEMSMRPDIPRGAGERASLGDVVFVSLDPESGLPAAISFARGNMFMSVLSVGDRMTDVSAAAEWLDAAMSRPPAKSDLAHTGIEARSIDETALEAGRERVVIESIARESQGGWLKVLASEGELRQEGDSLIYVPGSARSTRLDIFIERFSAGSGRAWGRGHGLEDQGV